MNSGLAIAVAAKKLASTFSGQLLQPADVGYDDARKVHNGLVDKRPALIARSGGVADVVGAVELARNLSLEVAVRGGGHNVAGRATIDGGLMIDLAPMKGIYVDPRVSYRSGSGWRHLGRAQSRDATARACGHRRCRVHHRNCGAHARGWTGVAHGQIRIGTRQPSIRGGCHGRR